MSENQRIDELYQNHLRPAVAWIAFGFSCFGVVLFAAFASIAIWESVNAVTTYLTAELNSSGSKEHVSLALRDGIKAVEFMLLAPLSLLLSTAIGKYVVTISDGSANWKSAFGAVSGVKVFSASLLASIVAVDLVGSVLEKARLDESQVGLKIAIFVALLIFVFVLSKSHDNGGQANP